MHTYQLFDGEKVLLGIDTRLRAELSEVQACLGVDLIKTNTANHVTARQTDSAASASCGTDPNRKHPPCLGTPKSKLVSFSLLSEIDIRLRTLVYNFRLKNSVETTINPIEGVARSTKKRRDEQLSSKYNGVRLDVSGGYG